MSKRSDFIQRQWRWTKRFFLLFPFWIALITGINIWNDAEKGSPFDAMHLVYAAGFLAFSGILYLSGFVIFRFVRGSVQDQERGR